MALGEFEETGEAKPGDLRRSSTLPCFRLLAGLNGPANSSVPLLLVVDFTAASMGVASFPLAMEEPIFATGALKVNPAEGEKEGGLDEFAMTMGEEKVKGRQGGVEAAESSVSATVSLAAAGGEAGAGAAVTEVVGGGAEKLKVGRLKAPTERAAAGRSGTSMSRSSSGRLEEGRVVVLSRFILPPPPPPPDAELLAAGVLDSG